MFVLKIDSCKHKNKHVLSKTSWTIIEENLKMKEDKIMRKKCYATRNEMWLYYRDSDLCELWALKCVIHKLYMFFYLTKYFIKWLNIIFFSIQKNHRKRVINGHVTKRWQMEMK